MCGHAGPDGEPLPQSPDTIVRRAMDRLRDETGVELLALGEVEYFLGKRRDESDTYGADDRGFHSVSPFVFGEPLRRRALQLLVDLGLHVKYGHSEVGYIEAREPDGVIWEQHEIELELDTLPRTEGLDALLEATSAARVAAGGGSATSVPWSFREVAMAVAEHRETFEAGGVFPAPLLDRLVSDLAHI